MNIELKIETRGTVDAVSATLHHIAGAIKNYPVHNLIDGRIDWTKRLAHASVEINEYSWPRNEYIRRLESKSFRVVDHNWWMHNEESFGISIPEHIDGNWELYRVDPDWPDNRLLIICGSLDDVLNRFNVVST